MRYFIHLAYDGTNYCGWQVQANAPSVQQTINESLQKLLRHPVSSMGCGRTDSGVHAKDFYMHFDTPEAIHTDDILFRLNCVLPEDISVFRIIPVADNAHARFDATERSYEYYVYFDKSPFIRKYAFHQGFYHFDWESVLACTDVVRQTEDFTSLCLPSEDFKTNICRIREVRWDILPAHYLILKPFEAPDNSRTFDGREAPGAGEVLRFTVTSNRFLRGMIRKIVGTILLAGKGKLPAAEFRETVAAKAEFRKHYLAPPNGLFLSKIKYPYIN